MKKFGMEITSLKRQLPTPTLKQLEWAGWKIAWKTATNEATLLGLLHGGFDWHITGTGNQRSYAAEIERFRTFLYIADFESGYSETVRVKAFNMLFGTKHLQYVGIFPHRRESMDWKELKTLLWFLRLESTKHHWRYMPQNNFQGTSRMVNERFLSGLGKVLPEIWFAWAPVLGRHETWFRPRLLRTILWHASVTNQVPLVEYLFKDVYTGNGSINESDLDQLVTKLQTFDTQALTLIKEHALTRTETLEEAEMLQNKSAQLLTTIQQLQELTTKKLEAFAAEKTTATKQKAEERRHSGYGKDQDEEQHRRQGAGRIEPAHPPRVGLTGHRLDQPGEHIEPGDGQHGVEHVGRRPREPRLVRQRRAGDHRANAADDQKTQRPPQVGLGDRTERSKHQRRHRDHRQHRIEQFAPGRQQHHKRAQQRIDAHLGQQPGEQRRDRRRRRMI